MDGFDWKEERVPPRAHFEIFYFRVYYFLNASIAVLAGPKKQGGVVDTKCLYSSVGRAARS